MTRGYLLDTDVVIEVLRGRADHLRSRFAEHADQIHVSVITVMELAYGSHRSSQPERSRAAVAEFLTFVDVLELDEACADEAGQVRAELAGQGTPIGAYDLMIAGHARARALTVVTGNQREFSRVPGLLVESW